MLRVMIEERQCRHRAILKKFLGPRDTPRLFMARVILRDEIGTVLGALGAERAERDRPIRRHILQCRREGPPVIVPGPVRSPGGDPARGAVVRDLALGRKLNVLGDGAVVLDQARQFTGDGKPMHLGREGRRIQRFVRHEETGDDLRHLLDMGAVFAYVSYADGLQLSVSD